MRSLLIAANLTKDRGLNNLSRLGFILQPNIDWSVGFR
jgi:hypothetical protein